MKTICVSATIMKTLSRYLRLLFLRTYTAFISKFISLHRILEIIFNFPQEAAYFTFVLVKYIYINGGASK